MPTDADIISYATPQRRRRPSPVIGFTLLGAVIVALLLMMFFFFSPAPRTVTIPAVPAAPIGAPGK